MKVNANLLLATVAIVATGIIGYGIFKKGKTIVSAAGDALQAVNPVNPDNVVARATNAVVQAATGDGSASLGSWLYDKLSGDTAGAQAVAPTGANVIRLADYFAMRDQEDMDQAPPEGFDSGAFASTEGGAALGNPFIARKYAK